MRRVAGGAALVSVLVCLAACGDDEPTSVSEDLTFSTPDGAIGEGQPGDLLYQEPIAVAAGVAGTGVKIRYLSSVPDGNDSLVPVSGVVIVPNAPPPPGGYPIVSWAHGTTGTGDQCAPSRLVPFSIPMAAELVGAGFVVAATDYFGQDGFDEDGAVHPYLVGEIAGRNVLDIALAARRGFGAGSTVVTWGFSQGGHASLWAHGLAANYSAELDLVGSAAFAPVTDVAQLAGRGVEDPALAAVTVEIVRGWATGYEQIEFDEILLPTAADQARLSVQECAAGIEALGGDPLETVFGKDPSRHEAWKEASELNAAPATGIAPVLLSHGGRDGLVLIEATDRYAASLCGAGVDVQYYRVPEGGHVSVLDDVVDDAAWWTLARVLGEPATSNCADL